MEVSCQEEQGAASLSEARRRVHERRAQIPVVPVPAPPPTFPEAVCFVAPPSEAIFSPHLGSLPSGGRRRGSLLNHAELDLMLTDPRSEVL